MFSAIKLNSNEYVVQKLYKYSLNYFKNDKHIHVNKLDKNTIFIEAATGFGAQPLGDYSFIIDYSIKNPEEIIIATTIDEAQCIWEDRDLGFSHMFLNGESNFIKDIKDYDEIDSVNIYHTHKYDELNNINCLEGHFGYIYKMIHPKLKLEYRGKRTITQNEKWNDYKGSSALVNHTNKHLNISEFEKHLIHISDHAADLELMEIKSIALFKAIDPNKSLNISLGSKPAIREKVYSKIFSSEEEQRFNENTPGALETKVVLFFESLSPKEYEDLCEEIEEFLK